MRKVFEIGGVVAAAVLIAFGIAAIVMGADGQSTVNSSLKQEQITGSGDMTPTAIAAEVKSAKADQAALFAKLHAAGVQITPSPITTPSCSVAGKLVDNGDRARCFAEYMRIHTFESTSGLTYSQMARYIAKPGTPVKYTDGLGATSDPKYAQLDPKTQQPVSNGRRDLWVVVGVALLLAGLGFGVLAIGGALRSPDTALTFLRRWTQKEEKALPAAPAV
jgi:hypothetical protein